MIISVCWYDIWTPICTHKPVEAEKLKIKMRRRTMFAVLIHPLFFLVTKSIFNLENNFSLFYRFLSLWVENSDSNLSTKLMLANGRIPLLNMSFYLQLSFGVKHGCNLPKKVLTKIRTTKVKICWQYQIIWEFQILNFAHNEFRRFKFLYISCVS